MPAILISIVLMVKLGFARDRKYNWKFLAVELSLRELETYIATYHPRQPFSLAL
jgi:hypothetical protein